MNPGVNFVGVTTPFYCNDGQGRFLLHRRSNKCRDEQGRWEPGSGELEFGQTPKESVLREVFEEYGCVGKIQEQLPAHSILRQVQGHTTHWVAIPFFVKVNPYEVRNNEPEKIDEIGWFTLDKLPNPLHRGFLFTFEHYREYFQRYSGMNEYGREQNKRA